MLGTVLAPWACLVTYLDLLLDICSTNTYYTTHTTNMLHPTTHKLHVHTEHTQTHTCCTDCIQHRHRDQSQHVHTQYKHYTAHTHIIHTMHTKSIDSQTKHISHTNTTHHICKHITKTWYTTFTHLPCIYTDVFQFRLTKQRFSNFLDVEHSPGTWEYSSYDCGYICFLCLFFMYLVFPKFLLFSIISTSHLDKQVPSWPPV